MSLKDSNPVNRAAPKRVAIVLSNPATSPTTGWPVGFWWSALSHPYFAFHEKGYEVEVFPYIGGAVVADAMRDPNDASGYSPENLISQGFIHTPALMQRLRDTSPVSAIDLARFDAIAVVGPGAHGLDRQGHRPACKVRGVS